MSDEDFGEAKQAAFRLLAVRDRSQYEIEQRLLVKGFSALIIEKTIDFLNDRSYLDDEKFGYGWSRYRMENRPIGSLKIRYELQKKGIDRETVSRIVDRLFQTFNETESAISVAQKKMRGGPENPPLNLYNKIFGYLMMRGFPAEVAKEALGKFKWV